MAKPSTDPYGRLMRRVDKGGGGGCWLWMGPTKNGYAYTGTAGGGFVYGHRLSYERSVGPIPDGHRIHHECEEPRCVNPAHLSPVTASEHAREHGLGEGPCSSCGQEDFYIGRDGARTCRGCRRRRRASARMEVCPNCGGPKSPESSTCSRRCGALLHNKRNPKPLPPHGTTERYRRDCRCRECKMANAAYARDYRVRRGGGMATCPICGGDRIPDNKTCGQFPCKGPADP